MPNLRSPEILLDARPLASNTGIARYTSTLIRHLPDHDPDRRYGAYCWRSEQRLAGNFSLTVRSSIFPGRVLSIANRIGLPLPRLGLAKFRIFHGTSFDVPRFVGCSTIMTCHDVAFLHVPDTYPPGVAEGYIRSMNRALKNVDVVVVDSLHTQQDLIGHFRIPLDRTWLVYPAVIDPRGLPLHSSNSEENYSWEHRPYFLAVGDLNPRKNLSRLLTAFSRVTDEIDHDLIIAGPAGTQGIRKSLQQQASHLHIADRVRLVGAVSDEVLGHLYENCTALVAVSLYEGFGYTVAEAAARARPIITSARSSLPEVAGAAALLVDPRSVEAIAEALRLIVTDDRLRMTLSAAGPNAAARFGIDQMLSEIMKVYASLEA